MILVIAIDNKLQVIGITPSKTPGIVHHSITLREESSDSCLSVRLLTGPGAIHSGQDCVSGFTVKPNLWYNRPL